MQRQVESKIMKIFGGLALLVGLICWTIALFFVTTEKHQGDVYRIIYIHVPSAFTAFFCALMLAIYSILGLIKKKEAFLQNAKAWAEVGCVFTITTLLTGSIWGKPTWGTWWEWDARLTTTFILGVLYAGFLILHSSLDQGIQRIRVCSILGILIFADVPIIYKSVTWWRTIHQPPTLMRSGGSTMSAEIYTLLMVCIFTTLALAIWIALARRRNLLLTSELEKLTYEKMNS